MDYVWISHPGIPGSQAEVPETSLAYWQSLGWVLASGPAPESWSFNGLVNRQELEEYVQSAAGVLLTDTQTARDQAQTAAASVQRELANGVAGLNAAGKLYEARIPTRLSDASLAAAYASQLTATAGDQTARINTFLAAAAPLGVKRIVGDFTVSDTVTIPAGLHLDLSGATITQTGTDKRTLLASGAGSTIMQGRLIGKGTDYVAGVNSPTAIGLDVTAADVQVIGTKFEKHAGAGIRGNNAVRLRLDRVGIVGVGGIATIAALDDACYGVYLGGGCTDVSADNLDLTDLSIGFIASHDSTYLSLSNVRTDRIPGQHGIYLQCGTGLKVDGVRAANVNLNAMKVQLTTSSTADSVGAQISNITGITIGDTVLMVYNTDTNLATGKKHKGVSIANVRGHDALRVLYLANVRGGMVTGIAGENTTQFDLTLIDCQDVEVDGVQTRTSGRSAVLFSTAGAGATGSSTQRVTVRNVRSFNPCNENNAASIAGISIAGPVGPSDQTSITLDGVEITATNSTGANTFMRYGLHVHANVNTSSLRVRNFRARGWSSQPASLAAATKAIGEWTQSEATTTVVNFPVGLLTRIGSIGPKTQWVINAAPTNGAVQQGDVIHNSAPAAAGAPGWVATAAGGLHNGTWVAATAYVLNDWRRSSAGGRVFEVTVAGTSDAAEPAWSAAAVGDTFVDGTATWVCRATALGVVKAMASLAA